MSMAYYFVKDMPGRKGNRITISTVLSSEYNNTTGLPISKPKEYLHILEYAQDRTKWRELVDQVVSCQHSLYLEPEKRRTERRQAAKRKREEQAAVKAVARVRRRLK